MDTPTCGLAGGVGLVGGAVVGLVGGLVEIVGLVDADANDP